MIGTSRKSFATDVKKATNEFNVRPSGHAGMGLPSHTLRTTVIAARLLGQLERRQCSTERQELRKRVGPLTYNACHTHETGDDFGKPPDVALVREMRSAHSILTEGVLMKIRRVRLGIQQVQEGVRSSLFLSHWLGIWQLLIRQC